MASGVGNSLRYKLEAGWGTDPGAVAFQEIRKLPAATITQERSQISTQELNSRRALTAMRLGTRKTRVSVPFELFYSGAAKQFDDLLTSWMKATWTAAGTAASFTTSFTLGAITNGVSVVTAAGPAGTTLADTDVGKWYKLSGSTTNVYDGFYRLTAWTSTTSFTLATGQNTVVGAGGAAVTLTPMAYIKPGTTTTGTTVAFEEKQSDLTAALYKKVLGGMANGFSLSVTPDQIVTGSFDFFGKSLATGTTAYSNDSPTSAPTTNPMTANDSLAYIMIDNVVSAVVSNFSLSGTNNLEDHFPVGSLTPYDIAAGTSTLTGSMDLYLLDGSFWTKYAGATESSITISLRLMDPDNVSAATAKGYAIDIPNVKITNLTENKTQTNLIQSVSWTAVEQKSTSAVAGDTPNMTVFRLV